MSSEKKTASNRINARKSTGSRSAAGKAVVSRNALKHGFLSANLIVEGESPEEFSELLCLLSDEFEPVGLVEQALVERVGIALWRQRRLVRAESAEVSINRQRFGDPQKRGVRNVLDLDYSVYEAMKAPEDGEDQEDIPSLQEQRRLWKSLIDEDIAETDDPFSQMSEEMREMVLDLFGVDAGQIDSVVQEEFGSWIGMFQVQVSYYESLIRDQRIRDVSRLVMQSQALPTKTDLLARYQTAHWITTFTRPSSRCVRHKRGAMQKS